MHSHGIEINLVISIVERRSIYWGSMFESVRRKQKPSGQNIFPNQRVIFCVFIIVFFFFTDSIQWSIIVTKIECFFSKTWLGLVHTGRRHLLTQPLPNYLFFSHKTSPEPLWPSWQLWAQICRSSWRLRIGSNVCKRCSLGLDIILFFSLQLYNTSILSWEVQFSEKSQHCSSSEHRYFTRSSSSWHNGVIIV